MYLVNITEGKNAIVMTSLDESSVDPGYLDLWVSPSPLGPSSVPISEDDAVHDKMSHYLLFTSTQHGICFFIGIYRLSLKALYPL